MSWFEQTSGRRRAAWLGVDAVLTLLLAGLLGVVLLPTFGPGWLWVTVLGGALVGLAVGALSWWRHWGTGRTSLALVAAWFLTGGALAMPATTTAGIVPTGRTLRGLAQAPLTAWKATLTFDPPIGATGNLLCVPLALALLLGLGACLVSQRSRRPHLAWLPGMAAVLLAAVLGTGVGERPVVVAIAACLLALAWTSHRLAVVRGMLVRSRRRRGLTGPLAALLVVGLACLATVASAGLVRPASRPSLPRDLVEQPLDLQHLASPLQAFRSNVQPDSKDKVLFTIDGTLPAGAVVRLATLDAWDGLTYEVTNSSDGGSQVGQFRRVGTSIATVGQGDPVDVRVGVDELTGNWVPTIGTTSAISFTGPRSDELSEAFFFNRATQTGVLATGLRRGDAWRLRGFVVPQPTAEQVAAAQPGTIQQPAPQKVPDIVADLARQWRGNSTGGEAAQKFEKVLREGYFSHGTATETPSAPGHSAARVQQLLQRSTMTPPSMLGDEEQYAVAMALLSQASGIPSRVVYGYRAPAGGSGSVTASQVGAWPELLLDGLGWVRFDPTPPHDRTLKKLPPDNPPPPNKHVEDPPPRPRPPQNPPLDTSLPTEDAKAPRKLPTIDWRAVGQWTALFSIPLVFLVGPVALVLVAKRRRRMARRKALLVANRAAGAWAEVVDRARDLGTSPSPSATRSEQAEQLVLAWPELVADSDPIGLAKQVDERVFRPEPVTVDQAEEVWAGSSSMLAVLRRVVPRWRWIRSVLSTRSLRKFR